MVLVLLLGGSAGNFCCETDPGKDRTRPWRLPVLEMHRGVCYG
jgi:hypothetical protein